MTRPLVMPFFLLLGLFAMAQVADVQQPHTMTDRPVLGGQH